MTETDHETRLADERRTMVAMATARSLRPSDTPTSIDDMCNAMQPDLFRLDSLDVWNADDATLAVIEHLGQTFDGDDAEHAVVSLGKVMCFAAILAHSHSLSIAPILELAREFTRRPDVVPLAAASRLAAVARKDDAEKIEIVEAIALCIAKGIDDCEMLHGLRIEPNGVYLTIAREMVVAEEPTARKAEPDPVADYMEQVERREAVRRERREIALVAGVFRPSEDEIARDCARADLAAVIQRSVDASATPTCGVCGQQVSQRDDGLWRCQQGHEVRPPRPES